MAPGRSGLRTPDEARATVAAHGSVSATARALGMPRSTVQATLRRLGVDCSGMWVESTAPRRAERAERDRRIVEWRRKGWSVGRIGARYGLTPMRVWEVLQRDLPVGDPARGPLRKGGASGPRAGSGAS